MPPSFYSNFLQKISLKLTISVEFYCFSVLYYTLRFYSGVAVSTPNQKE